MDRRQTRYIPYVNPLGHKLWPICPLELEPFAAFGKGGAKAMMGMKSWECQGSRCEGSCSARRS